MGGSSIDPNTEFIAAQEAAAAEAAEAQRRAMAISALGNAPSAMMGQQLLGQAFNSTPQGQRGSDVGFNQLASAFTR